MVISVKKFLLAGFFSFLVFTASYAQTAYFIDGYHGGVFGHYPEWKTQFILDELEKHPDWFINLDIEPETWDSVRVYDNQQYKNFVNFMNNPETAHRVEFVGQTFGQSFLYNISGESVIRQFEYGINKIKEHFPNASLKTYNNPEPCYTSALPQILKSFGFKYASLKHPNTLWGGYNRAFNGELVNWVGPDGTGIDTSPRYECEALRDGTTHQTIAWANDEKYIHACQEMGIENPVGVTLQDAMWDGGPWLGLADKTYRPSVYTTWTNYFENIAIQQPNENWHLSQEDLLVSLVWGSQILQQIAQNVRVSENKIIMAEKIAAMGSLSNNTEYPQKDFDAAWRSLLLAQHHDSWIVPYNNFRYIDGNWADMVEIWTDETNTISENIIHESLKNFSKQQPDQDIISAENHFFVKVFNTIGKNRKEPVVIEMPENWGGSQARVLNQYGEEVSSQIVSNKDNELVFTAEVPSMGYAVYKVEKRNPSDNFGADVSSREDGIIVVETDLYRIAIDSNRGGTIQSLIVKQIGNKEFVDQNSDRSFNELRGFFYDEDRFCSSVDLTAEVEILENGPLRVKLEITGLIDKHPFTQMMTVYQGEERINFALHIDWQGNPGIGKYSQADNFDAADPEKAFYNDKYKLLALFPLNLEGQNLFKNAPFDVTESILDHTFFNRWDEIKHNIILNWVDVTDASNEFGMALFSDHTTSYAHGADHPLGLNLQYSGVGLWGRNYRITGPSLFQYSLVPHEGNWDTAGIWTKSTKWNEPLVATKLGDAPDTGLWSKSFIEIDEPGIEITTMKYIGDNNAVSFRLFNAETDNAFTVSVNGLVERIERINLQGEVIEELDVKHDVENTISSFSFEMPRFGIRTLNAVFQ